MSVGAVIRYSMTLDGREFIQELRQARDQAKQSEVAFKQSGASVSQTGALLNKTSRDVRDFGSTIGGAARATGSFNALQSAFSQAIRGNFVGAVNSGTSAMRGLYAAATATNAAMTLGIAAAAAVAGAVIAHFQRMKEKADETRAAMKQLAKDEEDWARHRQERDVGDTVKQTVDSASEDEARKMLKDAERVLEIAKGNTDLEQQKKAEYYKSGNAQRWQDNESVGLQEAERMEDEAARRVALLKEKLGEIETGRKKLAEEAAKGSAEEAGTAAAFEDEKLAELDQMRTNFKRKRGEDAQKTPLEKLEYRRKYLLADLEKFNPDEGAENDIARQKIVEKIYETERAISAEKKSQADAEASKRKTLEAAKEEYIFSKKSAQEQLASVNAQISGLLQGPRNADTETQMLDLLKKRDSIAGQMDEADGDEEEESTARRRIGLGGSRAKGRRRMGMSRNSQDWMRKQMQVRREAAGFVPDSTHEKEPAAVKVEGTAEIKTLLQQIDKKLE